MAHEDLSDLNKLWQDQPAERLPMTVEDIRNRAGRLGKKVGWRNLREYAGAAFVVLACVAFGWREKNVTVLIGAAFMVLATAYIVYHLHRFGAVRPMPADLGLRDCLDFHRAELVRQRDLYLGVWRWYLLPMVPGWALIMIGRAIERPDRRLFTLGSTMVFLVLLIVLGKLNERIARRLQGRIEDLDRAR
jgi:hypothetical protein